MKTSRKVALGTCGVLGLILWLVISILTGYKEPKL